MKYIFDLRFVKLFAYKSAKSLQNIREESHKHRYAYHYGFQVIYGAIIKGLLLMGLSLLLGIFIPTLVATGSFVILRVFAGGLHFRSYTLCTYVSLAVLLLGGLFGKYVPYNLIVNIIVFIYTLVMFVVYSPVENENKPIKEYDKEKFKIISIENLIILFLLQFLIQDTIIRQSILYGVLLAGVIVNPYFNNVTNPQIVENT